MVTKIFGNKDENKNYYKRTGAYAIIIKNGKVATVRTVKGNFLIGGKIENTEREI